MKIAIHHRSKSFSDRWTEYCVKNNIPYEIINGYSSDIIKQVKTFDIFMWHPHHLNFKDVLASRNILNSLEHAGIKVFPDWRTAWHFDDKVAQKYLLEAIGAPLVPSYVFYDKKTALAWVEQTDFPKVWKLKGGAGSQNVQLIHSKKEARKYVRKAFGKGFSQFNRWGYLKERVRKVRDGQDNIMGILKGLGRLFIPTEFSKMHGREKGYIYFQEFIPNNDFDIRIIVIGNRAFGLKRMVRKNDFRASGSGQIVYDRNQIDERCVQIAFDVNNKIQAQSIAFDFVFDQTNQPLIVEISYGYTVKVYDNCEGFWNDKLEWFKEQFNPQEWMVKELLKEYNNE